MENIFDKLLITMMWIGFITIWIFLVVGIVLAFMGVKI